MLTTNTIRNHLDYSDIIHMARHEPSIRHPRMSRAKRAAQFAAVTMVTLPKPTDQIIDDYGDWDDWYGDQSTADDWCEEWDDAWSTPSDNGWCSDTIDDWHSTPSAPRKKRRR